jgi:hypothetical protein
MAKQVKVCNNDPEIPNSNSKDLNESVISPIGKKYYDRLVKYFFQKIYILSAFLELMLDKRILHNLDLKSLYEYNSRYVTTK